MTRKQIQKHVLDWLKAHQAPNVEMAPEEDYRHFVEILTDVAVLGYNLSKDSKKK